LAGGPSPVERLGREKGFLSQGRAAIVSRNGSEAVYEAFGRLRAGPSLGLQTVTTDKAPGYRIESPNIGVWPLAEDTAI
jgi:hypothetical protein